MVSLLVKALRKILLIWSALTFLPAWLVTVRGLFDGDAYAWGVTSRIRGRGTGGYYFLAPLAATYGLALLVLGWRDAGRPFHLMLNAWHVPLGLVATVAARRNREALRVQGDSLGIDISLAGVAPGIFGSAIAGSIALAALDRQDCPAHTWSSRNKRTLGAAIAVIPLQFVLLRFGKQHGLTDKIGVILTIAQWGLINLGLALRD